MRGTSEPLLDDELRSDLPTVQSRMSAQPNEAVLTDVNESVLPDDGAGGVDIAIQAGGRSNTPVPPGYTDAEVTAIWQSWLMTFKVLLCCATACVEVGIARLCSDKLGPLLCIVLITGAGPTFVLTCAYFILRSLRLEPTWSLLTKVTRCIAFAFFAQWAAAVNLGLYAYICYTTTPRPLREVPAAFFYIMYCFYAAAAADIWLINSTSALPRMMALSHKASAGQVLS